MIDHQPAGGCINAAFIQLILHLSEFFFLKLEFLLLRIHLFSSGDHIIGGSLLYSRQRKLGLFDFGIIILLGFWIYIFFIGIAFAA